MKLPRLSPRFASIGLARDTRRSAGIGPQTFCSVNRLTDIDGWVGDAAQTGCYDSAAFSTQQSRSANNRTTGMYILSTAYARGLGYHKVGIIDGGDDTNAVCHIPTQHGIPRDGQNLTCSGKVSGTYYSYNNLYSEQIDLN
ncbi:MAG: hypothetical protein AAF799_29245 [Myxococcota bacterium]